MNTTDSATEQLASDAHDLGQHLIAEAAKLPGIEPFAVALAGLAVYAHAAIKANADPDTAHKTLADLISQHHATFPPDTFPLLLRMVATYAMPDGTSMDITAEQDGTNTRRFAGAVGNSLDEIAAARAHGIRTAEMN